MIHIIWMYHDVSYLILFLYDIFFYKKIQPEVWGLCRSMVQTGRVVLPIDEKHFAETWQVFRQTQLLKAGIVSDLPQLNPEEYLVIEDSAETALPSFTGQTFQPSKGERVFQLGDKACVKILESCCTEIGGQSATKPTVLFVDMTTHTGDFARAFTHLLYGEPGKSSHMYYMGFCENEMEASFFGTKQRVFFGTKQRRSSNVLIIVSICQAGWVHDNVSDHLGSMFMDGSFCSPVALPETEAAEAVMPPQPTLNTLAYNNKTKTESGLVSLRTPDKILTTWHDHSTVGKEFQEFLASLRKKYPLDLPPADEKNTKNKRGADGKEDPALKRAKVGGAGKLDMDPPASCVLSQMPDATPLTHRLGLAVSKTLELSIAVGHRIFLKNTSKEPAVLRKGVILAGFYKGKWVNESSGATSHRDLLFELHSGEDMVLMGNNYTTMADIIKTKRATAPADANVGFHDLADSPKEGQPGHFILTKKHDVYFRFEDVPVQAEEGKGGVKVSSQNVASCIPPACWATWLTEITWSVRWPPTVAKGLQPVRPYVTAARTVTLPGEALVELKAIGHTNASDSTKIEKKEEQD